MTDTPDRTERPADEAPPGSGSSAENACPRCGGDGELDGETCTACGGTGRVEEAVGGG
jgi:DnaJ-class molecular chaperone